MKVLVGENKAWDLAGLPVGEDVQNKVPTYASVAIREPSCYLFICLCAQSSTKISYNTNFLLSYIID